MLNKLAAKIASFLGETSDYGINLSESAIKKKAEEFLKWESLGDLLPYRSYDPEYGLFIGNRSIGFVLEVGLFVGSDTKLENDFVGLFKSILPPGSCIQFLLSALPKVEGIIDYWNGNRSKDILSGIEEKRADYFRELSRQGKSKFRIRDFRGILSVSIPMTEKGRVVKEKIVDLKKQVKALFETRGQIKEFKAEDLINYLSDILNYDGSTKLSSKEWNKHDALNSQIIEGMQYTLKEDGIVINNEYEMRLLSVSRYPAAWSFTSMNSLIGDSINDYLKIPCSFFIHLGVQIESSKFKKTGMLAKASRVESQAASPLGNWIPALKREAEEWSFVREQLEKNERLIKMHYQVMLIDKPEDVISSEQIVLSLYRSNGWEMVKDRFIVLSSLISMLPLSWAEGICDDMAYFKKLKTTLSYEPVNLLPLQGEFKGTHTPGMLLAGRRGQLFYWYPFDEGLGNTNYNVAVVGRSGAGKSVFMQELATSILRNDGRVYVLDVGRSFEKQVKQFEGQFLEFTVKSDLCLNPFSSINDTSKENVDEALSVLKPIISMMAAPKGGTNDYEDSIIEKALMEVWAAKGKDAGIADIAEWFSKHREDKISTMLYPYSRGAYSRYFNGKANIDFSSKFFVVELEELKSKPDLQKVATQIFMVLVTNQIVLGDRKTPSALILEEAWDKLQSKQDADLIAGLARRVRKCKGSIIVGTQNLDDFYSSPGAEAAFMNSDWLCCLKQKSESIALLKKSDKFKIDDYQQKQLESINTKPGEYAEAMIMTSGAGSIGRLILDPFSRVLYSTKPEEYSRVMELQTEGLTIREAVERVAREKYG